MHNADRQSPNLSTKRKVIFAGGGTAGHVEPALAVANKWMERYPADECIFIGTESGLESSLVPRAGFELKFIEKVVLPRRFGPQLLTSPWKLFRAVRRSRDIIKGASLLIGFGGYVSAPAYLAARLNGITSVVHEANAKVGWANRLGSLLTNNLAVAHKIHSGRFARATVTGLPLRQSIAQAAITSANGWDRARNDAKAKFGWSSERPSLLVLGGSQGSVFINEQISLALSTLVAQGFQILHSVGGKNALPQSSRNYTALSYIEDMSAAYLAADVVIARSGAVTCAEFGALGRFAIFVPLQTGNGEQGRNADFLVEAEKALVISQSEFSSEWLIRNAHAVLERSAKSPKDGLKSDLKAVDEIVTLMSKILEGAKA